MGKVDFGFYFSQGFSNKRYRWLSSLYYYRGHEFLFYRENFLCYWISSSSSSLLSWRGTDHFRYASIVAIVSVVIVLCCVVFIPRGPAITSVTLGYSFCHTISLDDFSVNNYPWILFRSLCSNDSWSQALLVSSERISQICCSDRYCSAITFLIIIVTWKEVFLSLETHWNFFSYIEWK
jgi:hypothetical protein